MAKTPRNRRIPCIPGHPGNSTTIPSLHRPTRPTRPVDHPTGPPTHRPPTLPPHLGTRPEGPWGPGPPLRAPVFLFLFSPARPPPLTLRAAHSPRDQKHSALWAAGLGGRRSSRSVAIARFESQLLRLRPPPPKSLARLSSSTRSSGSSSGCEISGPRRLDTSTSTLEDDGPPAVALLRKGISLPAVAVVGAKTITHRRSHAGSGSRKAETGRYKRILADTISTFPQAHVRAGPRARTGVPYQRRR